MEPAPYLGRTSQASRLEPIEDRRSGDVAVGTIERSPTSTDRSIVEFNRS
jgi:hypothetical protein